jgi:GTP-binding protein Era
MPDSQERPEAAAAAATQQRCGFVAVIGAPNAGKSTLVNAMVGAKVSIVSHKVQTTRAPVRGIAIEGSSQLVFIDTPGIFRPKRRLDRAMVDAAWGGAHDADIVVLLVDAAKGIEEDLERILDKLAGAPHSKILALNKVDRVADKDRLLPLIAKLSEKHAFDRVFLISALDGNGVADLKRYLAERMPRTRSRTRPFGCSPPS